MADSEVLTIGSVIRHRGEYNEKATYYTNNQVTMCGCIFQAVGNSFTGIAPLKVAEDKTISIVNTPVWKCILDNIAVYNAVILNGTLENIATPIPNEEIEKLF